MTGSGKYVIIVLLVLLALGTKPFTLRQLPLDNHECFVSVTAREMLDSGNWVIPTCNGQLRLEKMPLLYWLVAAVAGNAGTVNEFSARLPSAVFGVLSVMAVLYFVNKWLSFRIAAISAGVWATTLAYIRYSGNARPEIALTFFVMLCFLSFYSAVNAGERKSQVAYMLVFWVSLSLGMLAKGPAPLPYVLAPLFCYVAVFKKWRIIPRALPIIGPLIFVAIVLPWPLFIAQKMNWDLTVWKHEFVDRLVGDFRPGHKPNYYYLGIMFQFMAPWVAFVPMALAAPFFKVWNKKRAVMFFLWIWFIAGLVFITIDRGKRQHYILPLIPAMAILVGIVLEDMVFVRKAHTAKFAADVFRYHFIVIMGGIIGGTIYAAIAWRSLLSDVLVVAAVAAISLVAVAELFRRKKQVAACVTIFGAILVVTDICYVTLSIPLDKERHSRDFSRKVASIVPSHEKLIAYKSASNRFVQYVGRVVPEITDYSALLEDYQNGHWVVATGKGLQELREAGEFTEVYYKEKAERKGQDDVPGGLFYKGGPSRQTSNPISDSKSREPSAKQAAR